MKTIDFASTHFLGGSFVLGRLWHTFGFVLGRLSYLGCVFSNTEAAFSKTSRDMKLDPKVTQIGPKCDPNRTQTSIGSVLGSCWAAFGSTFIATSKRAAARPWLLPSEAERHQTSGKGFRSASFYGDRGAPWSALGHQAGVASTKWSPPPQCGVFAELTSRAHQLNGAWW